MSEADSGFRSIFSAFGSFWGPFWVVFVGLVSLVFALILLVGSGYFKCFSCVLLCFCLFSCLRAARERNRAITKMYFPELGGDLSWQCGHICNHETRFPFHLSQVYVLVFFCVFFTVVFCSLFVCLFGPLSAPLGRLLGPTWPISGPNLAIKRVPKWSLKRSIFGAVFGDAVRTCFRSTLHPKRNPKWSFKSSREGGILDTCLSLIHI